MEDKSFKQFDRCPFCRINHNKGEKHAYSKHHIEKIKSVLCKYEKKIKDSKDSLQSPMIESSLFEIGAKFWCYFCEEECNKHMNLVDVVVKYGGLLTHIAQEEHDLKSQLFWKKHRIQDRQRRQAFIISQGDYIEFEKRVSIALKAYLERHTTVIGKKAEELRQQASQRARLVYHSIMQQESAVSHTHPPKPYSAAKDASSLSASAVSRRRDVSHGGDSPLGAVRTVAAHGQGLTCLSLKRVSSSRGNVHTGAPPPWLQQDGDAHRGGEIAPTESDWKTHLKHIEKAKLPPGRVGANRGQESCDAASWMPNFGSVWSKQSRTHHRKSFMQSRTPYAKSQGKVASATESKYSSSAVERTVNHSNESNLSSVTMPPLGGAVYQRKYTKSGPSNDPISGRIQISKSFL